MLLKHVSKDLYECEYFKKLIRLHDYVGIYSRLDLKQCIEELTPIIDTIMSQNHNIALVADTNINLLKMHENSIHCDFFDLLMSYSLNPQINLPTRFTETRGTLIDNIFCKLLTPTNINCAGILINTFSDHQPCFIIFNAETNSTQFRKN